MANVIVLFEVKPTKAGLQAYLDRAAMLKPLITACTEIRSYSDTDRFYAPEDSNHFFEV